MEFILNVQIQTSYEWAQWNEWDINFEHEDKIPFLQASVYILFISI